MKETVRMIHFLKLRSRLHGDTVDDQVIARAQEDFRRMPKAKQDEILGMFKHFDDDSNGTIDDHEFVEVLESMGIDPTSKEGEGMIGLSKLLDRDNSGALCRDEFTVLMALALAPRSPDEEQEDIKHLYDIFDEDKDGDLTLHEIVERATRLNALANPDVMEEFMEQTVYECFRRMKTSLTREDFAKWMAFLDERFGNSKDHKD